MNLTVTRSTHNPEKDTTFIQFSQDNGEVETDLGMIRDVRYLAFSVIGNTADQFPKGKEITLDDAKWTTRLSTYTNPKDGKTYTNTWLALL